MSAASKLFSERSIKDYWETEKSKFPRRTSHGADGQSRDDFANTVDLQAKDISSRVRSNSYSFRKLRPFAIPKGNGKVRLINVPTIRDRVVQRMLLKFLADKYREKWKMPQSFSSMGGDDEGVHKTLKSIRTAVRSNHYVIKADLSQYFDTINRPAMFAVLKKHIRDRSLYPLLEAVICCETSTSTSEEKAIFKKSNMKRNLGLRQGMPLSPVFSYLFLADIDMKTGGNFYRYIDDLLFFGPDKEEVKKRFENYRNSVEERGLKIHKLEATEDAKTKLIGPNENFHFLGVKCIRSDDEIMFEIPAKSKTRIMDQITADSKFDRHDQKKQKRWVMSAANKAASLVRNYHSAYHFCSNWPEFENELRERQLHMCRSIASELHFAKTVGDTELLRRLFGI